MLKLLFLSVVNIGLLLSVIGTARADATLFEQMILMEAAYEPLMGRVAVAAVALDRIADATGTSLEEDYKENTEGLREELGINEYEATRSNLE